MNQLSMTYDEAWAAVGGLSAPSKMPCHSWSISALRCNIGAKLVGVKDSVCAGCYALRGNYRYSNVKSAHERRFDAIHKDEFVPGMVYLLKCLGNNYFRWLDAGDITPLILNKIVEIAKQTPNVKHWLPTKEYKVVQDYIEAYGKESIPDNLNIRLSGYMVDADGPVALAKRLGLTISEVRKEGSTCPSSNQGNKCLDCRNCWDKSVANVVYKKH